jgi:LysM repeat protein
MKDNVGVEMNDDDEDEDDGSHSRKERGTGLGGSKVLQILLGILLVFIFVGGILYFLGRQPAGDQASLLQLKVTALEQKIAGLEKDLTDIQGKIGNSGLDPALFQRVDALAQKVESLEKQKQSAVGLKGKPSVPSKPEVATEKRYHKVQKGETLLGIARRYKISVEELRKLNNLSPGQQIRTGQKLLIATKR